jgi:hypothetical protein
MDDARRFFRYLIPGLLLFLETGLFLFGVLPDWTIELLKESAGFDGGRALGLATAFVVTSGTLGFVLSMVHHTLYWLFPFWYPAVDYRRVLRGLRRRRLVSDKLLQADGRDRGSVMSAWIILTKLWHERLKTSRRIAGATKRADLFANLVHSTGACRIALWSALVISTSTFLDLWNRGRVLPQRSEHWIIAIFSLIAAITLLVCGEINYRQTHALARNFVLRVIRDALIEREGVAAQCGCHRWLQSALPTGCRN